MIVRILLYLFGFFLMEYANDDTTDIPEIYLNICVAVQPCEFQPLGQRSRLQYSASSVNGSDSDRASAESNEQLIQLTKC